MSERAVMKRRVRGLLHRNWLPPLCATLLAWLPLALVSALLIWLLRPHAVASTAVAQITFATDDLQVLLVQVLALLLDPWSLIKPLLGWLPLALTLLVVHAFVGLPLSCSLSGYYLAFLRGKSPKVSQVFSCFSGRYPRYLGGMAYRLLWQFLWLVAAFIAPLALMLFSALIVSALGVTLNVQLYLFAGILALSVLWMLICAFVLINRLIAYSLTPVCIAAQPRLAARRAVRLSRKLMRGHKGELIGLLCSFLHYLLPCLLAVGALIALPHLALAAGLSRTLRLVLLGIVIANQLVWLFLLPYVLACFNAYYIERKREALMDDEITDADLVTQPRQAKEVPGADERDE